MKESHVVTCFLMDPEKRVLILRRSNRVGSYRGRWGGVAGYLEATPLEQAFTEIREEVGLERSDVGLLAEGKPLEVADISLDRRWIVHPFLFAVTDPSKIKLDWEHTEYRWIDPGDIRCYDTVPGLPETLDRVYRQ